MVIIYKPVLLPSPFLLLPHQPSLLANPTTTIGQANTDEADLLASRAILLRAVIGEEETTEVLASVTGRTSTWNLSSVQNQAPKGEVRA